MLAQRLFAPVLASIALASAGCTDDDDASLLVANESDFVIEEIYLTEVNDRDWGPNLLFNDVLAPDEALLLNVECGLYDALLIDEDGVECEIPALDLCDNNAEWVIENETCAVFGARKAEREAAAKLTGGVTAQ